MTMLKMGTVSSKKELKIRTVKSSGLQDNLGEGRETGLAGKLLGLGKCSVGSLCYSVNVSFFRLKK